LYDASNVHFVKLELISGVESLKLVPGWLNP